jgi:SecD/SecF fusion protein
VLNAGSLPTALNEQPISRLVTGPTLGWDTIVKGCWAVGISTVLVAAFMLIYYRFSGVVACGALLMNLVFTVAIMITVKAAFTLPGLAGLALTLGMAVDGNILVFERIREELARGAALRMAIRNGFSRATSAIVDSNLTTVITGVILYVIGTDQVKGFAITLTLGVLFSMYTAVFCSHVVFDVAERRRWITKLTMMQLFKVPHIDFVAWRYVAIAFSLVVIAVGLVGVTLRSVGLSVGLLDIDFTGGVSVVAVFDKPQRIADVRAASSGLPDLTVSDVQLEGQPGGTWYQINTSQADVDRGQLCEWAVELVQQQLERAFGSEANTEKRRQAIEAFRGQVLRTLETKSDSPQHDSAVKLLQQQVADLFAAAPQPPQVKSALETAQRQTNRIIRVNTPTAYVEEYLHQQFPGGLATNSLRLEEVGAIGPAEEKAARASPQGPTPPAATDQTRDDLPSDRVLAMAGAAPAPLAQATPPEAEGSAGKPAAEKPSAEAAPAKAPDEAAQPGPQAPAGDSPGHAAEKPAKKPGKSAERPPGETGEAPEPGSKPAADPFAGGTKARLTFARQVSYETVMELFDTEFGSRDAVPPTELVPLVESPVPGNPPKPDTGFTKGESTPYGMWNVKIKLPPQQARSRLESIQDAVAATAFFPSSNTIGGTVAQGTRIQGIYALAGGMLCIIVYLWFRFQRVAFGLAAVLAVVHDVLVTLGAIALSSFLAPYLGFLMVDPFKIGLSVVVAFLTIIGFSVNDTIVIFDRIREIRGKAPRLTDEMVNTSVNQTLSRTLLTTLTVLMVVVILYVFGGEVMHAFSFAMLVGLVAGTYSTVYIASPLLLWMIGQPKAARG